MTMIFAQRREVFCKIRCPLHVLCKHADLVDYKLAFDSDALRELCGKGREVGIFSV